MHLKSSSSCGGFLSKHLFEMMWHVYILIMSLFLFEFHVLFILFVTAVGSLQVTWFLLTCTVIFDCAAPVHEVRSIIFLFKTYEVHSLEYLFYLLILESVCIELTVQIFLSEFGTIHDIEMKVSIWRGFLRPMRRIFRFMFWFSNTNTYLCSWYTLRT